MLLGHRHQHIEGAPVHDPEVACISRNLDVDQGTEQTVKQARRRLLEPGLAGARPPLAVDDIAAIVHACHHRGQQLGRVLQIGVNDEDSFARTHGQAGRQGKLMSIVARQIDADNATVGQAESSDSGPCGVPRTVVDENDLVPIAHDIGAYGREPPV
jgi:hypothetical protein